MYTLTENDRILITNNNEQIKELSTSTNRQVEIISDPITTEQEKEEAFRVIRSNGRKLRDLADVSQAVINRAFKELHN